MCIGHSNHYNLVNHIFVSFCQNAIFVLQIFCATFFFLKTNSVTTIQEDLRKILTCNPVVVVVVFFVCLFLLLFFFCGQGIFSKDRACVWYHLRGVCLRCVALYGTIWTIQKCKKHPWRSVTFSKAPGLLKVTLLWVIFHVF